MGVKGGGRRVGDDEEEYILRWVVDFHLPDESLVDTVETQNVSVL